MAKLTEEQWVELVAFYHEGHSYKECSTHFGISMSSIANYFGKHPEIPRRKPFEPARPERAQIPGISPVSRGEDTPPPGDVPITKRRIVPLKGN